MADPLFKLRDLIERENIRVFSSNYALYADMSRRVVETLSSLVPEVEIYSIDESFLDLSSFPAQEVVVIGKAVRDRVRQWTGIPTCVGIGPTKTLAKLGNGLAKKRPVFQGVCDLRDPELRAELLPTVPVEELWGIGRASTAKLAQFGVTNAAQLASMEPGWARRLLTVVVAVLCMSCRESRACLWNCWPPPGKGLL
jgi:DNA polymerase V